MKKALLLMFMSAVLMLCACGGTGTSGNENSGAEVSDSQELSEEEPTEELSAEELAELKEYQEIMKYNTYIGMSNAIGGRFSESIMRYEKYFGLEEEMRTDDPGGLYSLAEYHQKSYSDALEAASTEPPMDELDNSVKSLAPKLLDMCKLINEMESYYELKNYVDDNFEKGKEYHAQLIERLDGIYDDLDWFYGSLAEFQNYMQTKGEEQLKDEGMLIQYQTLQILASAKALSRYLDENELDNENVHTANMEEFKPYYDALTQSVNEFMELLKDEAQIGKESEFAKHRWFSSLKKAVEDLKKSATNMYELVQEGKKASISGSGSPSEFAKKISDLVSQYNNIIDDIN